MKDIKKQRINYAINKLNEIGLYFEQFNNGIHLKVEMCIDYWPTTGKWHDFEGDTWGNGFNNMLKHLRVS